MMRTALGIVTSLILLNIGSFALAWTIDEDIDPFTDKGNVYVFGQDVVFRCMNNKFSIHISFDDYLGGDELSVIYRFDKHPPVETDFDASADGTAVFVRNTNDFALDAIASEDFIIRVYDYRGVTYTKKVNFGDLPDEKIEAAANACDAALMPTRPLGPTPSLDAFSDDTKNWLSRMEPEVTICLKEVLNKFSKANLEISPMRDNGYFDALNAYFDDAPKRCGKIDVPSVACGFFEFMDGDVNEWRSSENVGLLETYLISDLIEFGNSAMAEQYNSKTCRSLSWRQMSPFR